MTLRGRTRPGLAERVAVDAALDDAFAPLRRRGAPIGPARVRAALRWERPEPVRIRGLALFARISEVSAAAVLSALMFGATLASVSIGAPLPDLSRDAASAGEWELNGRIAAQRPIDSRATDYRTVAGDLAANAAIVRRDASRTDPGPGRNRSER